MSVCQAEGGSPMNRVSKACSGTRKSQGRTYGSEGEGLKAVGYIVCSLYSHYMVLRRGPESE